MKKVLFLLLLWPFISYAQIPISVGSSTSQNFDILGTSATATLPANWKVDKNGSAVRTVGTYSAALTQTERIGGNNLSTSAGNGIYNFGLGVDASAADRSIGGISSSSASKSINVYAYFLNGGSSAIKRVDISYDVFRFRNGLNAAGFSFQLYYSTDGINWTSAGTSFLTSFAPNSDNSGGQTVPIETKNILNQTLSGLNISPGGSLYLAWNYSVTSGTTTSNAQALGIDNFVMNNISSQEGDAIPSAPTALNPTGITADSFTANWNSSVGANNYLLDVSTSNSFTPNLTGYDGKSVGNVTSASVTGLNQKTQYYYRLRAANNAGSSTNSNTIAVKTDSLITKVQFSNLADAVAKSSGSYDLTLTVTNPSPTNATTCMVSVVYDSSYSGIANLTNFTSGAVTFPAGSSSSQKVTVNLINSSQADRSRKAYFKIHTVTGGLNAASTSGSQSYFYLTIMSGKDNAYYSSISTNLTGNELKTALYNLIKGHIKYPYTDNSTDVWDIVGDADEDPKNPKNVIGIYSGLSILRSNQGLWNREHVWAKSHGNFGTDIGAGTDCHHLRAENNTVNTTKSNLDFDNGGTLVPGSTNCYYDSDSFEPRNEVKGDVARMIFYMATRYRGENGEPNLDVVDYVKTSPNGEGKYGKLSTLLQWNIDDPVDAYEINRNNNIYFYQHNRNPYIDNPEWITKIWGGPVGINDGDMVNIITSYDLSQNYPNPFNPSTTLKYSIPNVVKQNMAYQQIQIKVYDILGREIVTLVNDIKPGGTYQVDFNAGNLPSGIYFARLQAGNFTKAIKMQLIK